MKMIATVLVSLCIAASYSATGRTASAQQAARPPAAQQGDQQMAQARAQLDRANRDIGELYSQIRELQTAIADGRLVDATRARQAFIAEIERVNDGLKVDPVTLKVQPGKDAQPKKE